MFLFRTPNPTRILIRGIITSAVGITIVVVPGLSLNTVIQFLGMVLVVDGLINLIMTMVKRSKQQSIFAVFPRGTTSIIAGILLLLFPQMIVGVFVFLIGFILVLAGFSQLASQLGGRSVFGISWLSAILSFIALVAGIVMLLDPFKSAVTILIFVGIVVFLYGAGEIVWSFKIRKYHKQNPPAQPHTVDADYEEVE